MKPSPEYSAIAMTYDTSFALIRHALGGRPEYTVKKGFGVVRALHLCSYREAIIFGAAFGGSIHTSVGNPLTMSYKETQ